MKEIIIINGSPRQNGATGKILKEFERQLKLLNEYKIDYYNISELQITPCVGCCNCYKEGQCFIKDEAEELSIKIERADGIIIGSPTYSSNISGELKVFIDRGHFVIEQLLKNKYAISVVTGENYGKSSAKSILNKLFLYSGANIVGSISCNIPFNSNPLENRKIAKKILKLSCKLNSKISDNLNFYFQEFIRQIIFKVGIKPFVLKKELNYNGIITRWRNNGII